MDDLEKLKLINSELEMENNILKDKIKEYKVTIETNKLDYDEKIRRLEQQNSEKIKRLEQKNNEEILNLNKQNQEIRKELNSILYSRSYKFTQKIKKILKRR